MNKEIKKVKKIISEIDMELQIKINETHETERYDISDGEMAKIIMEKGRLLLKELNRRIDALESKEVKQ